MGSVARVGDTSSHGGFITSGSSTCTANGLGIARSGDTHSCPIRGHGVTALTGGSSAKVNGQAIVRIGDSAGCGAVINSGSGTVTA